MTASVAEAVAVPVLVKTGHQPIAFIWAAVATALRVVVLGKIPSKGLLSYGRGREVGGAEGRPGHGRLPTRPGLDGLVGSRHFLWRVRGSGCREDKGSGLFDNGMPSRYYIEENKKTLMSIYIYILWWFSFAGNGPGKREAPPRRLES